MYTYTSDVWDGNRPEMTEFDESEVKLLKKVLHCKNLDRITAGPQ